jgi:3-methylcrotonyl-CoA carboxylase alpha subunit
VFPSVLIANRGEIACRIIRTARRLGMRSIAVFSEADAESVFVSLADEVHPIGPAPALQSYLAMDKILDVAQRAGAACIHPGYGFLSERAEFADACAERGIVFVGPPAQAIRAMGLKDAAKALVAQAGVPIVPGYHGARQEPEFLRQKAYEIGYPVLIKAVAGGGGKGMRRVDKVSDFEAALASAQREAAAAFGDARVLVEKYVLAPRHIEIQVFGDRHGNVVHLFERDCSLQRRHQKVIEEAPAPGMSVEMRQAMGKAAVDAAKAVGYVGAGTVEFIADARQGLRPDRFFFMEMNTRLQVEHPVTEAITGLDLVEWQFRVAAGEALPLGQDDLAIAGHAIEARLYAEDPTHAFLPSTGRLWALAFPEGEGIRVDSGVEAGDAVTPFYDPMIAKIIAHGASREAALDRMADALGRTVVAGPKSNVAFLMALCSAEEFRAGGVDTGFIDANLERLGATPAEPDTAAIEAGALYLLGRERVERRRDDGPWSEADAFQLLGRRQIGLELEVEGHPRNITVAYDAEGPSVIRDHSASAEQDLLVVEAAQGVLVLRNGRQTAVRLRDPFDVDLEHLGGGGLIKAPMHGKVVAIFVAPGDRVEKGAAVAVVEAMKMEHGLVASEAGEVIEVAAAPGDQVAEGATLIVIQPESSE